MWRKNITGTDPVCQAFSSGDGRSRGYHVDRARKEVHECMLMMLQGMRIDEYTKFFLTIVNWPRRMIAVDVIRDRKVIDRI